jgi:hypothetical protein
VSNVTFGQYANNLAKQRVLDQLNNDRAVLVTTLVGLILAISVIFGWVGMSRQNAVGYVATDRGHVLDKRQLTKSDPDRSKPLGPKPFPSGVRSLTEPI